MKQVSTHTVYSIYETGLNTYERGLSSEHPRRSLEPYEIGVNIPKQQV
jgi:hypothetical protein